MKAFTFFIIFSPLLCLAKLQLATTTADLSALVSVVGGEHVDVFSLVKGTQDPHELSAKPSAMVKLRRTQLIIAHGLELEQAWLTPLREGARNTQLLDKKALFELGPELNPLEIATKEVSRADGDVHPGGNPHFQLDPLRLGEAAVLIADRLAEMDPANKKIYVANAVAFKKMMNEKIISWKARIQQSGVKEIVTYHKTFTYFCARFDIKCNLHLEPKPGIDPTPAHIMQTIKLMKNQNIKLVFIENLYQDSITPKLKSEIPGIVVERLPVSVGGEPAITTNAQLIERIVSSFEKVAR